MRILAVDAGQTGIRTLLIESGIPRAQAEHPGILTSERLIPQLARVVLDAVEGPVDVVAVGSTGLTAEETDPGALRRAFASTPYDETPANEFRLGFYGQGRLLE
jgi:hypothetical protein